jgi:broad specificity phosphatase PhoE
LIKKGIIMTSIYLVRHGQTAWNKEEIFRGRTDVPLDETGLRQAELAGEYFKEISLQGIYSSPLSRAWQTAERIARPKGLKVEPLEGLIDMSFGSWEGRPLQEVREVDQERYRQWRDEPQLFKLPDGEGLDEIRSRAMAVLERIVQKHPEETVVLVSHRVVNKVLLCGVLGIDNSHFWQIAQDTTAINLIQYKQGRYVLSLMNETCHLKALHEIRLKTDF